MKEAAIKNRYIISLLDKVLGFFDSLTFENFDINFPIIVSSMVKINRLKSEMILNYGKEHLQVFEKDAYLKAKQIEERFDNLVVTFSEEEKRLEKELEGVLTKKKLTAYLR